MLESVGDGWEESRTEDHNFEIGVATYSPDTSEGIFDVLERGVKLS